MVLINSGGAAGAGSATPIVAPAEAKDADKADDAQPGTKIALEKRSAARKEKRVKEGDETKKSWIKLKLVDEAGNPVPGEAYKVKTSDGRTASGTLNDKGEAEVKGIEPGDCQVSFPNLDKDAWEDA
jgi:type VI secretion system secreted protein VgrG